MGRPVAALVAGVLFGAGLALAQMTDPAKVLGFLDVAGNWDPSLMFVLGGAVGVTVVTFRFILRRPAPLLDARFHLPTVTRVDRALIAGALVFGAGWGISGYCPGPGVALLAAPNWETWVFLPALIAGATIHRVQLMLRERGIGSDGATPDALPAKDTRPTAR